MAGAQHLGKVARDFPLLEIRCDRCGRHGRLRTTRLIDTYGPNIGMPDLAQRLTSDCPNRDQALYNRCSPYFPQLSGRR